MSADSSPGPAQPLKDPSRTLDRCPEPESDRLESGYRSCERIARIHYENFPVASIVVPRRLRRHFFSVYAFCRISDDLGDEGDPSGRTSSLDRWETLVHEAFAGRPADPLLAAVDHTRRLFCIPEEHFFDLIRAFKQDQVKTRYETEEELLGYCRYSANPVGRIVLQVFGGASHENLDLSDRICTGLQLANCCQDVGVDLLKGRVYVPMADFHDCGYTIDDLRSGLSNPAFRMLMQRQVSRARRFLQEGMPLWRRLSFRAGIEIRMVCLGGLRILERIERQGCDVLSRRPSLNMWDFFLICARLAR